MGAPRAGSGEAQRGAEGRAGTGAGWGEPRARWALWPSAKVGRSPGKSLEAAPPPVLGGVRGGRGRRRQGSGCGGGAARRVGAGVLLSCMFSRLQRRNFVAGSGAGAADPQLTARAAGRAGEQRPSRQVPWARMGPWRLVSLSFPISPDYRTGLGRFRGGRSLPFPWVRPEPWPFRTPGYGVT